MKDLFLLGKTLTDKTANYTVVDCYERCSSYTIDCAMYNERTN